MNNIYNIPLDSEQQQAYNAMMKTFEEDGFNLFRDMVYLGNVVAAQDVTMAGITFKLSNQALNHTNWNAINAFNVYQGFAKRMPVFFDVLTPLFHHLKSKQDGKKLQQHFTPWSMAKEMGKFSLNADDLSVINFKPIIDPTCGAGGALLGLLAAMDEMCPGSSSKTIVLGCDLDPLCCAMTTVQLMFNQFVFKRPVALIDIRHLDVIKDYHSQRKEHGWWLCINNPKAAEYLNSEKEAS